MKKIWKVYCETNLILRIIIGLILGLLVGIFIPSASAIGIFGDVFVGALKAIAPILVFFLVISSLANAGQGLGKKFRNVILLYMISTLLAACLAVFMTRLFPITITLTKSANSADFAAPSGIGEVLGSIFTNMVSNPVKSITEANYVGILTWAIIFGIGFKSIAGDSTKAVLKDISDVVSRAVKWIINFAPFGIMGLVYKSVAENGIGVLTQYVKLIALIAGCVFIMAFILTPLIVFICIRKNPYPLVLKCLKESGLTAFFTRSSAANIPINMALCEKLNLDKDFYSVSIPLGATMNMDGAAIVITIMSLTVCNTLGIVVDLPSAILLSVISTLGACGASGIAGGSLLLIPMACSLFGISNDIAMQAVAVGFIIGVIQDSLETAVNSAGDVIFTATAEFMEWKKEGREIKY